MYCRQKNWRIVLLRQLIANSVIKLGAEKDGNVNRKNAFSELNILFEAEKLMRALINMLKSNKKQKRKVFLKIQKQRKS